MKHLGHIIGGGQLRPDPEKLDAIQSYPRPITKSQVNSFIGLASYYRKFVPNFATIATPLTNLVRKKQPEQVQWTPDCETAFEQLKANLTHSPVLKVPEVNKPYIIYTDASDVGLGAVLARR